MRPPLAVAAVLAAALAAPPAAAWDEIRTLRIFADEIARVVLAPQGHEDPSMLVVDLASGERLEVEGDNERAVFERCAEDIETLLAAGGDGYVELAANVNARSLNGVLLIACAVFPRP